MTADLNELKRFLPPTTLSEVQAYLAENEKPEPHRPDFSCALALDMRDEFMDYVDSVAMEQRAAEAQLHKPVGDVNSLGAVVA